MRIDPATTLRSLAQERFGSPLDWRAIAEANDLDIFTDTLEEIRDFKIPTKGELLQIAKEKIQRELSPTLDLSVVKQAGKLPWQLIDWII